ncbi:MAG TPA: CHASE3 domain-containing protein [Rhizomicrobium sp.]|nr:CHASE3 domain-containing protein [Rhizomicrobium sp.]
MNILVGRPETVQEQKSVGSTRQGMVALHDLGLAVLLVGAVLFIAAMLLLGANLAELRQTYVRVQHSNSALLELSEVRANALMMELAYRGYLLTGNSAFMTRGEQGGRSQEQSFRTLSALFAEDPGQMTKLARLRADWSEFRLKLRALRRMPHDQAVATIASLARANARKPLMQTLKTMQQGEENLLSERVRAADLRVRDAFLLALGILVVAVVAAALGFALILDRRRAAEAA